MCGVWGGFTSVLLTGRNSSCGFQFWEWGTSELGLMAMGRVWGEDEFPLWVCCQTVHPQTCAAWRSCLKYKTELQGVKFEFVYQDRGTGCMFSASPRVVVYGHFPTSGFAPRCEWNIKMALVAAALLQLNQYMLIFVKSCWW